MTDPTSTLAADDEQFAVIITLPTWGAPEGIDQVRRVGPYANALRADSAEASFRMMLHSSAPDGTTVDVGPYDVTVPHLDPYPPADVYGLAEAICDEPDGPGRGWGFPDLYARLSASIGHDRAGKVWGSACTYLDDMAEAEAAERAAAAKLEAKLAPLREQVATAAARRGGWYSASVLDDTVWLLHDMLTAAAPRDVTLADFGAVVNLPGACLDVTSANIHRRAERLELDRAAALLGELERALGARGVGAMRSGLSVQIVDERAPMWHGAYPAVALRSAPEWSLFYAADGGSPVVHISATFDETGARAVADMIAELVGGTRPNPLDR